VADVRWEEADRLVRFGATALAGAPDLLAERGFADFVLLSTKRSRGDAPALADAAVECLDVEPGPVPEAAAAVRGRVRGRPVVALGGGRVIDAAKAIAAADGVACGAVPTTLSGAELTRVHRLPTGVEGVRLVRPSLVISDPGLMASQPLPDLAASAMNALGHAVEALWVPAAQPISSLAALEAARLIADALAPPEPDRPGLALGATLAAWAMGETGFAVHHVVCQSLVAAAGTPHALTNAILLAHCVAFVAPRAPVPVGRLAAALGGRTEEPRTAAARIADLSRRAGPRGLRELGVGPGERRAAIELAIARPQLAATPGRWGRADLAALLEHAT
jgi:alcohol dehydrogenase class IV